MIAVEVSASVSFEAVTDDTTLATLTINGESVKSFPIKHDHDNHYSLVGITDVTEQKHLVFDLFAYFLYTKRIRDETVYLHWKDTEWKCQETRFCRALTTLPYLLVRDTHPHTVASFKAKLASAYVMITLDGKE